MGLGKTVAAAKRAKILQSRNQRMVFLAPYRELIRQAERTFHDWGVDVQVEQGMRKAHHVFGRAPHVIASKDSLYPARMEDFLRRTRLDQMEVEVFLDECHLAVTTSFFRPVQGLAPVFTVGLTGTPFRLDGRPLVGDGAPFEVLCCRYDFLSACRHGNLVSPTLLECVGKVDLRGIKITRQPGGPDYDPVALASRISEQLGHVCKGASEQIRLRSIRRSLGFFTDVGVCRAAEAIFSGLGFRCRSVYGDLPDRDDVIRSYHDGDYDIMTSCQMIDIGFDDRPTDGIILASPTQSAVRVLQRAGRGSRLHPGKSTYYVIGYAWETDDDGPQSTLDLLLRGVPDPDVRARAARLLQEGGPRPFLEVIEQAEIEERKARADESRLRRDLPIAVTQTPAEYQVRLYDPLDLAGKVLDKTTIRQLKKCGLEPAEIGQYSAEQARSFLEVWHDRTVIGGMATYKQVEALCRAGVDRHHAMDMDWRTARSRIYTLMCQGNRVRKVR